MLVLLTIDVLNKMTKAAIDGKGYTPATPEEAAAFAAIKADVAKIKGHGFMVDMYIDPVVVLALALPTLAALGTAWQILKQG